MTLDLLVALLLYDLAAAAGGVVLGWLGAPLWGSVLGGTILCCAGLLYETVSSLNDYLHQLLLPEDQ